ncbi:helix-turn-helix domain-containing protein [Cytobacillus sp. Hz8]|uniref:helix-turn-helix domain-containing protein n=1 Tax=Cytobacillus sp. Hz8 TaxID=3347168 RepID=UPI0035D6DCFF
MKKVTLNKPNLSDLRELSIGKRIRYIREHLQKECGNAFSGKSVANRIQLFSQSTLTTIERDKSKDVPSKVLYAISKDFGADLYMFFDDYYQQNTYESVDLIPPLYNSDPNDEPNAGTDHTENQQVSGANPLLENEYTIKTMVSKVASNHDEQLTFIFKSRVKYSEQHLFYLLSQIISQINTLDVSIEPGLIESNLESIKLAQDYIKYGKTSLHAFPWHSNKDKSVMDNQSHEKAVQYTEQLLEELKDQHLRGENQNE